MAGTEWAVVTTDDGKKYFYNGKSQVRHKQRQNERRMLTGGEDVGANANKVLF